MALGWLCLLDGWFGWFWADSGWYIWLVYGGTGLGLVKCKVRS